MSRVETRTRGAPRRPRLAIMGEFSSGKSTLSKLLLGDAPLPVRVTATRFPPVWVSHGEEAALAIGHDGSETELDPSEVSEATVEDTKLLRLWRSSDTLEICDLIDMPGISDPSMSPDIWTSLVDEVDSVVWCTQATQAWRQSEAAAWDDIAPRIACDSLLLVTQVDKLRSDRDVERVLARVRKETEGLFRAVYPLSIVEALDAGDNLEQWTKSGAAGFVDHLVDLLLAGPALQKAEPSLVDDEETEPETRATDQIGTDQIGTDAETAMRGAGSPYDRVLPKRVRVLTEMRGRVSRPGPPLGLGES